MPLLGYNEWKQWNENFPSIPLFGKKHIIGKPVAEGEEELPPEMMGDMGEEPPMGEEGALDAAPEEADAGTSPDYVTCPHCHQLIHKTDLGVDDMGAEPGMDDMGPEGDMGMGPEGDLGADLAAGPEGDMGAGPEDLGPEITAGGEEGSDADAEGEPEGEDLPDYVGDADDRGLFDDPNADDEDRPNPDPTGPIPPPPAAGDEEGGEEFEGGEEEGPAGDEEAEGDSPDHEEGESEEEEEEEHKPPKPKTESKKCCGKMAKKNAKKKCVNEDSFETELTNMMKGTVHQKYSSGLEEAMAVEDAIYAYQDLNHDINQPGPGEPGYAPTGKVGGGPSKLGTGVTMAQLNKIIPTQGK